MSEHLRERSKVALILGSACEGRLCDTVAAWVEQSVRAGGEFEIDVIDPLALELPVRHEHEDGPAVQALQQRLADADAFIVVTPEYNHSYPAALKFLIDSVYEAWQAKPVAFVSYGGIAGGLRAVEHLRHVFAELHAVGIRDVVSFANVWESIDERSGELRGSTSAERSMSTLLSRLHWWAEALRHARLVRPYQQVA
ncbi:NADPH-dependent FMN reductase [Aquisalimonas asiatica]|uniref:NAD(P)H-dependent FMN reductase n=1 Tax=Aquisalimonas asiatica TaxID=406100 RepID=A0A1H8TEG7_9GAMM|nr:NAD(P)H-dependent oxidoreductase [Aquisalimonas asiatica]SEO89271.1 NAD(P)H-dependent FMN reductase [Aquisalimonas asiatica]